MKIYTRAGDKGKTTLRDGKRVLKSHLRLEAYGSVDELSSSLGIAIVNLKNKTLKNELLLIQKDLFELGGQLAIAKKNIRLDAYLEKRVKNFEKLIDKWTEKLPRLTHFILPGGGKNSAYLHLSRTICRRAERMVVSLSRKETVDKNIIAYLNRLSDVLFTMARFANKIDKEKEIVWKIG